MTMPASALVAALNSLQKAMMFTPCWPSAGPTGGAGLAWPPGICNLICPTTFFAIFLKILRSVDSPTLSRFTALTLPTLRLLHLPVLQFHRRVAPENIHRHFQLAPVRLDL